MLNKQLTSHFDSENGKREIKKTVEGDVHVQRVSTIRRTNTEENPEQIKSAFLCAFPHGGKYVVTSTQTSFKKIVKTALPH